MNSMTPPKAMPKKAMVLAAGLGKRMRSYSDKIPKPLVQVNGKPLIDWSLDLLVDSGIEEVVVNTSYMAEMLEEHLRKRNTPHIMISREDGQPLETGGGIRKALPLLGDEPFFVLNSDVISLNGAYPLLYRMAERWNDNMDALLLMATTANSSGYYGRGDFFMGPMGELRRRREWESVPFVFAGIQLLHPRLFQDAPEGAFSMNVLYNRGADEERRLSSRIRGIAHDGLWLHVGDAEGHAQAEKRLVDC